MFETSRTETTKPFALRCFTHRAQHSQPGSLYTVTTEGAPADEASTVRRASNAAAEESRKWRRESMLKRTVPFAEEPAIDSATMTAASSPSARDRVALHILQAGALAIVLVALPYKVFDLDRYFVPKELVLHVCAATAALLCVSTARRLSLTMVDALLAAFLLTSVVSTAFGANLWIAERALAISLSGAALFWVASALRRAGLVRPLVIALAVGIVVGAATSLAQAYGVQTEYFSLNRAPGGTFGNRNFVAHLAAIGTPIVVVTALTARRSVGGVLGAVGLAILSATLVLSRSRAAWLAVIVLAIPSAGLAVLTWNRWCEPRTIRRALWLGAAMVVGAVAAMLLPNRLEWKSDSPYLDSAAGLVNYKEGSGRGRLVQYGNSLRMTVAHPVFGVGPGNWAVAYPAYASRNDPSMSTDETITSNPWPSSDWVAYLSERGVLGFALLLLAMLGLMGRALGDLRRGGARDPERVLTAIALVGTLVGVAVVGAFDAVLLVAVPTFFVWTLAGALAPPTAGRFTFEKRVRPLLPSVVIGLGVIIIGRSAAQIASIAVFSTSTKLAAIVQSARLDPGSYRVRTRLAQAYIARGDCAHARPEAHAAHDLFPHAAEPKHQIAVCGGK
jgi:O-antigen ligase